MVSNLLNNMNLLMVRNRGNEGERGKDVNPLEYKRESEEKKKFESEAKCTMYAMV